MIVSSKFWQRLSMFRVLYLGGPFGSGKTLFAVAVAWRLYRAGFRVWSNVPVMFADDVTPSLPLNTCVLLDEARRYADARDWKKNQIGLVDYARHLRAYFLLPAAFDVDVRLRRFEIRRIFPSVFRGSIWLYSARSDYDTGFLVPLLGPRAFFSVYGATSQGTGIVSDDSLFYILNAALAVLATDQDKERQAAGHLVEEARGRIVQEARAAGLIPS